MLAYVKLRWGTVLPMPARLLRTIPDEVVHQFEVEDRQVTQEILVLADELQSQCLHGTQSVRVASKVSVTVALIIAS